jgi:uncharacterized membrane protein
VSAPGDTLIGGTPNAMKSKTLLLISALCLLVAAPARATDFVVCNSGALTGWAATAHRNGSGLLSIGHTWQVTGWFKVDPNQCKTLVSDSDGEPIYVAVSFTDRFGRWGAFRPDRSGKEDDVFHDTRVVLCVARGEFDYTRSGSDPGGPCKDGYYPFPAALFVTPTASRGTNTYTFLIAKDDIAAAVDVPETAAAPPGSSVGKTAGAIVAAIVIGAIIADAAESRSDASRAPTPFDAGTLNAMLLGKKIVRRTSGGGAWYYENGSRVNPVYQLDGLMESDLLDAPEQRDPSDAEVAAAMGELTRALGGYAQTRRTEVLNTGRLFYSFEDANGVLHQSLTNLAALDLARASHLPDYDGVTGYAIPCRNDGACNIGLDKDPNGTLSNNHIYRSINFFFVSEDDGQAFWNALRTLRDLYPALPAVTAR